EHRRHPARPHRGGRPARPLAALAQRGPARARRAAAVDDRAGGLPARHDGAVRAPHGARGLPDRLLHVVDRAAVLPAGGGLRRRGDGREPRARHRAGALRPLPGGARAAGGARRRADPRCGDPLPRADDGRAGGRPRGRRGDHRRRPRDGRPLRRRDRLLRDRRAVGGLHGGDLPHPAGRAAHAAGRLPRGLPLDGLHAAGPAARVARGRGDVQPGHLRARARAPGDGLGDRAEPRAHLAGHRGAGRAVPRALAAGAVRAAAHGAL
ncbi:MAG: hypothetical protein AVDCRST_MAG30-868, partial [uncultured Solirubrobacteraceae bacterium]